MALFRRAATLLRPLAGVADARVSQHLCLSTSRTGLDDKEAALEEMYIRVSPRYLT